ncbi:MAG: JDVT-CTERM system CAAX-type protease [Gammaproteobacteria bacterium]|nr:JDVT-CTERM system CAAX-type protease [Gammaproteobacteria bacterium]
MAALIVWALVYFFANDLIVKQTFNPIYVIFIYPIVEELVFRGLIQDYFKTQLTGLLMQLSFANILTSVLFVLLHYIYHPSIEALLVFIPSLIFGYFKDRTGGVLVAIVLHIFYNVGYFYLLTN